MAPSRRMTLGGKVLVGVFSVMGNRASGYPRRQARRGGAHNATAVPGCGYSVILARGANNRITATRYRHMPSFDVVSELDLHEVANAVDQATREVDTRFDFRGTDARFELNKDVITLVAQADFQLKQLLDILKLRLTKRGIDIACLKIDEPKINLATARQVVTLRQGIEADLGKKLQRLIKDSKLKVQAAIQDKQVRVTGKSRDDLQSAMALIRNGKLDMPLQFTNFRD